MDVTTPSLHFSFYHFLESKGKISFIFAFLPGIIPKKLSKHIKLEKAVPGVFHLRAPLYKRFPGVYWSSWPQLSAFRLAKACQATLTQRVTQVPFTVKNLHLI